MAKLVLCQCSKCIENTAMHTVTKKPVQGVYLPHTTVELHRRADKLKQSIPHTASQVTQQASSPHPGNEVGTTTFCETTRQESAPVESAPVVGRSEPRPAQLPDAVNLAKIQEIVNTFHRSAARFEKDFLGINFRPDYTKALPETPPPLPIDLNQFFLLHEDSIASMIRDLESISTNSNSSAQARRSAILELRIYGATLRDTVRTAWEDIRVKGPQSAQSTDKTTHSRAHVNCERYFETYTKLQTMSPTLLASFLIAVILHLIPGLPRDATNFLLKTLPIVITLACSVYTKNQPWNSGRISKPLNPLAEVTSARERWFTDIRTLLKEFDLDPHLTDYACCKKCFSCYPKVSGRYPSICIFRETPNSPECGTLLTIERESLEPLPRQVFSYQPPASFLARLLSRPTIIDKMKKTTSSFGKNNKICWDIFDAQVLRDFKGPDGETNFLVEPPEELRLIFSLFVDFFNPYGNKAAGKRASLGGIYMICYNLPIELRYQIENVYIMGIIPGEPLLHHINHILRPLVSDLIKLWHHGVQLSRTSSHNDGCLVRVALLPLIADAPAARKTAGFPGVTATNFCIFCKQTKSQLHDYNIGSWVRHNRQDHMKAAKDWVESQSPSDRDKVLGEEHVRWSELLRLPYWDVTSFVVVDPMHTLFLNVVQHHVRDLWKVNDSKTNGRKGVNPHSPSEQKEFIGVAYSALVRENLSALTSVRRTYLELLVKENDIMLKQEDKSSILKLATALITWKRSQPPGFILKLPTPFSEAAVDIIDAKNPDVILDQALITEIRRDMEKTVLPGWINRAPKNFGSTAHGKVSADHWRTVFTINFVITLVRVWGHHSANSRQCQLLENFMALVVAIRYATARTTTEAHIQVVEKQLQTYYQTLSSVSGKRFPSHHMSLHIPECLRRFGPVHGWWSYPYERYNGILQRLNHNNKLNQLPTTFIRTFCQRANLKSLLTDNAFTNSLLSQLQSEIHDFTKQDFKGSLLNDILSAKTGQREGTPTRERSSYEGTNRDVNPDNFADNQTQIPTWSPNTKETSLCFNEYSALARRLNEDSKPLVYVTDVASSKADNHKRLLNPKVQYHSMISARGVKFAKHDFSLGNSLILFRPSMLASPRAGQIQKIFVHSRPSLNGDIILEFFYVVKAYAPLSASESSADPYKKFTLVDTKLYRKELLIDTFVIRTSDIISHFASCPFTQEGSRESYQVVLSLDRDLAF